MGGVTNFSQTGYRWRNDDGSQTTATWKANLNTAVSLTVGQNARIRLQTTGTGGSGAGLKELLSYDINGSDSWITITTSSAGIKATTSTHFADQDVTTEQLAGSQTFVEGHMSETGTTTNRQLSTTQDTESEFQIQPTLSLNNGAVIRIRSTNDGVVYVGGYAQYATFTVSNPAQFNRARPRRMKVGLNVSMSL